MRQIPLLILLAMVGLINYVQSVQAAVTLESFTVTQPDSTIPESRLDWVTGTESEAAGFYILRVQAGDSFPPIPQTIWPAGDLPDEVVTLLHEGDTLQFIPARGTISTGYHYVAADQDAALQLGQAYQYLLVEVQNSGNLLTFPDRIETIFLGGQQIYLPLILK